MPFQVSHPDGHSLRYTTPKKLATPLTPEALIESKAPPPSKTFRSIFLRRMSGPHTANKDAFTGQNPHQRGSPHSCHKTYLSICALCSTYRLLGVPNYDPEPTHLSGASKLGSSSQGNTCALRIPNTNISPLAITMVHQNCMKSLPLLKTGWRVMDPRRIPILVSTIYPCQ